MSEKLAQLKTLLAEVADLNATQALLSWDQQTYMPPGGGESRGNQLATIGKISHEKFTSDEIGKLLDDLEKEFDGAEVDSERTAPPECYPARLRSRHARTDRICVRVRHSHQQSL